MHAQRLKQTIHKSASPKTKKARQAQQFFQTAEAYLASLSNEIHGGGQAAAKVLCLYIRNRLLNKHFHTGMNIKNCGFRPHAHTVTPVEIL